MLGGIGVFFSSNVNFQNKECVNADSADLLALSKSARFCKMIGPLELNLLKGLLYSGFLFPSLTVNTDLSIDFHSSGINGVQKADTVEKIHESTKIQTQA